jgi:riboflavin kinase/FMN adenylyltransferase
VLVKSLDMKYIFVGHDFTFGKGRTGNMGILTSLGRRLGFGVEEKAAVSVEGTIVSSTMVRNLVQAGHVAQAAKLLGREFSVSGPVIRGVGRGRQLGFPTANIDCSATLMPPSGVYIVRVVMEGRHFWGVANLGNNPTFGARKFSFEVYVLDFDGDIYDKVVEVSFVDRIRDEITFSGPKELVGQIQDDIETARRIIKYYETRL